MKAVLALIAIYVGTFFVVIQGASQNPVQAARQEVETPQADLLQSKSIDPLKETDIRSLMELVGARDQMQDAVNASAEQFREKLSVTVPDNSSGHAFVNNFVDTYKKNFDQDQVAGQIVHIYDNHYSADDIKSLLQFFGSPLGQKVARQMPQINREIAALTRETGAKTARQTMQALKAENPELEKSAQLALGQRHQAQQVTSQP